MSFNFLPYDDKQAFLPPPSLADWVAKGSLARFVGETPDLLDGEGRLAGFYAGRRADGWGRAAYHPRLMAKVLAYGYCTGITSSRKLAAACEDAVAFRFLTANARPDFRTISDFRQEHLTALHELFTEILGLCLETGLVKVGRVALDGRKVQGNAALDRNRDEAWLKEEVRKLLAEAERVDAEEDALYGKDRRGDELPEELRDPTERERRLRAALARIDERKRQAKAEQERKLAEREEKQAETGSKPRGKPPKSPEAAEMEAAKETKANITDLESRILKTRRGWVQGYNGQALADCETQVLLAQFVTQEENDVHQLEPLPAQCEEETGERPSEALADAGYFSNANLALESEETEPFIATTKDWKRRKALREAGPPRGRIPGSATPKERMERKLLTERGREAYKQRGSTIEPVFGQQSTRGLNRFLLRGIEKVKAEWSLWCATHNLLKLWRAGWVPA